MSVSCSHRRNTLETRPEWQLPLRLLRLRRLGLLSPEVRCDVTRVPASPSSPRFSASVSSATAPLREQLDNRFLLPIREADITLCPSVYPHLRDRTLPNYLPLMCAASARNTFVYRMIVSYGIMVHSSQLVLCLHLLLTSDEVVYASIL